MTQRVILIADKNPDTRRQMADLCIESGYQVVVTDSAAHVLRDIMKMDVKVLLLGSEADELEADRLIPLLKKCSRDLTIILVSDEESLPRIRKIRQEGIFYHALKPQSREDGAEIRLAVECAFKNLIGMPRALLRA